MAVAPEEILSDLKTFEDPFIIEHLDFVCKKEGKVISKLSSSKVTGAMALKFVQKGDVN